MARLKRICPPGIPQHIIQRGNNRQACFVGAEDYTCYAHWLGEAAKKFDVAVHAWVFMTNHVHLLATPSCGMGVSQMMQFLGRRYVRYFNSVYQRTGTLWEGRFKSCVVDAERYFFTCQRYIELNPVRAGMVQHPKEYKWSSYVTNGEGKSSSIFTPHPLYLALGDTTAERANRYRALFEGTIDGHDLDEIRDSVNKGLALGSVGFKLQIEKITGRRVQPLKPGPKPE
jgi:putative transposase